MESKEWWRSKTLWAIVLTAAAIALKGQFDIELDPDTQAGMILVGAFLLRLITKQGLKA